MPLGPFPPGCIAICAHPAEDYRGTVSLHGGVCRLKMDGLIVSDVTVTGCTVEPVWFMPITDQMVALTVAFRIGFTFIGTIGAFTFHGRGSCTDSIFFVKRLLPIYAKFTHPIDCAAQFTCAARDAGFDPVTGVQFFIVHISGELTCVGCSDTPFTVVLACPSLPVSTS
jgi:hypothetical protein